MSEKVCVNVSVYQGGRLQQGYSLNGDDAKVVLRSSGFSITAKMRNIGDRPQARIEICGHTIFDTEDARLLQSPPFDHIAIDSLTALGLYEEARASVALDGQTQSEPDVGAIKKSALQ